MDNFRFMAEVGASMASERLNSVAEQARQASERAQQQAQEAASRMQNRASEMATSCKNIDLSKIDVQTVSAYGESLRESASKSVSVLGTTVSNVAAGDWPAGGGGGGGGSSGSVRSEGDGGSDAGGDDAGWSTSGGWGGRFGIGGAGRNPEKQGLIPKHGDVEAGSAGSGGPGLSSFSSLGSSGGAWSALQSVREYGVEKATSVGSGLGLVEKAKVPETRLEKMCRCCPTLTYRQRLLGFAVCFIFGGLLSLSALNSLPSLLIGNPAPFAFKYTFGNLLSICSSSFMVGPVKQCQDMAMPERRTASLVYVSSLTGTLISVFVLKWQFISFVLVIIQFAALTWYMLSYMPYGQQVFKRCLGKLLS